LKAKYVSDSVKYYDRIEIIPIRSVTLLFRYLVITEPQQLYDKGITT